MSESTQGKAPYQKPQMEIITLSQSEEFFSTSSCNPEEETPRNPYANDMPAMAVSRNEGNGLWDRW